ncbi:hypothetical protein LIER_29350 [Lithospermum erythrorhizon]|uniref:HMA domain-containing protein n=1 Tax=Lithospermum erythrorhizon TaxID=34254 RepID=A0AAV3RLX0_LITER
MASPQPSEEPPQPLQYQTWVLKVSIHCQGCKRKVKRVLQSIEGVYTISIDMQQQKVIVTGNIDGHSLIKKLVKSGKKAELWQDKPSKKEKSSGKSSNDNEKEGKKQNSDDEEDEENHPDNPEEKHVIQPTNGCGGSGSNNNRGPSVKFGSVETIVIHPPGPGTTATMEKPPTGPQNGGGGPPGGTTAKKKKKKKKKSSNANTNSNAGANMGPGPPNGAPTNPGLDGQNNMGPSQVPEGLPPPQQPYNYPPSYGPNYQPQTYVVSYNAAYPSNGSDPMCYMRPSYAYSFREPDVYTVHPTQLESFAFMSDENPNGCFVM